MINGDWGMKNLAYCILKIWRVFCNEIVGSQSQWKDLALGSEVVSLPFPANVPMHFIYGDITSSLGGLEKVKDVLFLLKDLADLAKTLKDLPGRIDELAEASAPLDKIFTRAILEDGVMDEATFKEVAKLISRNNMLRLQEFLKAQLSVAQTGMSFIEMFAQSPNFTKLMQIAGVAWGGGIGLLKTFTVDLYFAIQDVIFSGQPHDLFVPKWSAVAAFPEYSTGFPVTPGIFDLWHFKYGEICHQAGVAEFVGYLLKSAPLSEFAVLKESVPLPGTADSFSKTMKATSDGADSDIEIDFDNFYVNNFGLTIRKSSQQVFGDGTTALKFIANANIKASGDVNLVVQKDGLDRIFPMFAVNGDTFESILVFKSGDEGAMTAYCYAPSDKGNLYISNTLEFSYSDDFDDEEKPDDNTPPEITVDALPNGITGQAYIYQITASGTTSITWTHTGSLPDGLTLSESGLISGTPAKAGSSTFTVTATNSVGTDSRTFTLQVLAPVSITTTSLKTGTINKSYSVTLKGKGTKPLTWSATGLPSGLKISEKGKISGKPTAFGTFNVKITVSNGAGNATKELKLIIKGIPPKLSGALAKAELGEYYESGLKLTKGSLPITWSIMGELPDGLVFNASTGVISGTPASYKSSGFKLKITASNGAGEKSKSVKLEVKGTKPKITASLPNATAGQPYTATLTATGSQPITWNVENLPEGLTLNGDTISGTPTAAAKSYKVKLTAMNPVKSAKKTVTLKVIAASDTQLPAMLEIGKESYSFAEYSVLPDELTLANSDGYVVVAVLPEISVDVSGMYDFGIALSDDVPVGVELLYLANSDKPSADDEIAEFFDNTGEISVVPESRRFSLSIWINEGVIYSPAIAVKK